MNKKIPKEREKLLKLLKEVPKNKMKFLEHQINQAAILPFRLANLQDCMDDPLLNTSTNINSKENPAYRMYNGLMKTYISILKQLIDAIPENTEKESEDELEKFLREK